MSIKFICPKCNNTKNYFTRKNSKYKKKEEFANNEIFKCSKCNIRMNLKEVIADF